MSDTKEKKKIRLPHRPAADEDLFRDIERPDVMQRDIYVQPKQKRLPPWLIPLCIVAVIVGGLFFLVPSLGSRVDKVKPENERPVTPSSLPNGDIGVVSASSAFVYDGRSKDAAILTEVLLNETLTITDTSDRTRLGVELADGMRGYVNRRAVTPDQTSVSRRGAVIKVMIRDPFKRVMSHAGSGSVLTEAPMGAVFYADYHKGSLVRIKLPGGEHGWMSTDGVFLIGLDSPIEKPDDFARSLASTAIFFANKPYVPQGQTARGISPEGAIRIAARLNGVELPRSAEAMSQVGEAVTLPSGTPQYPSIRYLKEGDIVFFRSTDGTEPIAMAGICVSDRRLLTAEHNRDTLQLVDLTSDLAADLSDRITTVRRFN